MKRITFLFTLMLLAFSTQGWAESKNGTDFQVGDNWYLMLEDFEGTAPAIGTTNEKSSAIVAGNADNRYIHQKYTSYGYSDFYISLTLPSGKTLSSDFCELSYDIQCLNGDCKYKGDYTVKIGSSNDPIVATEIFKTNVSDRVLNEWNTQTINFSSKTLTDAETFYLFIGITGQNAEYYIDNIRLKYKEAPTPTDPVAVEGVSLKSATTITVGGSEKLVPTFTPSNATNKNVTWESNNTDVATVDNDGTVHGVAAGTATITVTTEDGGFTATCEVTVEETSSMNGQLYFDGTNVCLMVEDFEGSPVISLVNDKGGNASLKDITISDKTTKALKYETGKGQGDEYVAIKVALPAGKTLSDVYSDLIFDVVYDGTGSDNNYKQVKICLNETSNMISNAQWGEAVTDNWVLKSYSLSGKYTNENIFTLLVGGVYSNGMKYYIDNIRLKLTSTASGTNAGANIGWSYNDANTTLTFAGTGAMTGYTSSSGRPWNSCVNKLKTVVFGEGITEVGALCCYNAPNIESISFPKSIAIINERAFEQSSGKSGMKSLTIPENVTSIGATAFKSNDGLQTIDILSSKLASLGDQAFYTGNTSSQFTFHSFPSFGTNALYKLNGCDFVLIDNEHPYIASTNTYSFNKGAGKNIANMTYNRTFASAYSTIVLPFIPSEIPSGVTFYEMTATSASSVTFTELVGTPVAGKPYLIAASGEVTFAKNSFDATDLVVAETQTKTQDDWIMYPVFQKVVKTTADNAYGFSGGQLYKNTGNMTVNPFRAYFTTASSNAKAVMDVEFGNTPTAINNLENGSFEFNEVYNLNGVRQNSLQNGVNIVKMANGKTMKIILNK